MKFRKQPVVIEAVQWTGSNLDEVLAFASRQPDIFAATYEPAD
jgi:hypothetical protein